MQSQRLRSLPGTDQATDHLQARLGKTIVELLQEMDQRPAWVFDWLASVGLVMGAGTLGVTSWAEQVRTEAIAHTMGVVTFSLYALFFSIETRDERRTAFSLDTFSDSKFVIATGVSVLALLLTTVFGPLQAFLKTTSLDVRQWLTCLAVALSIVVTAEIRKAVRRRTAASHQDTR